MEFVAGVVLGILLGGLGVTILIVVVSRIVDRLQRRESGRVAQYFLRQDTKE